MAFVCERDRPARHHLMSVAVLASLRHLHHTLSRAELYLPAPGHGDISHAPVASPEEQIPIIFSVLVIPQSPMHCSDLHVLDSIVVLCPAHRLLLIAMHGVDAVHNYRDTEHTASPRYTSWH